MSPASNRELEDRLKRVEGRAVVITEPSGPSGPTIAELMEIFELLGTALALSLKGGRYIQRGDSYAYLTEGPYGSSDTFHTGGSAGDQQRYPEILVDLFGIDKSTRFLVAQVGPPGSVTGGFGLGTASNTISIGVIPEDCIIEAVWYIATQPMSGNTADGRRQRLMVSTAATQYEAAAVRDYVTGVDLLLSTPQAIMNLSAGASDQKMAPHGVAAFSLGRPPVFSAFVPTPSGFGKPATITWGSVPYSLTGTSKDGGGTVIIRLGTRYINTAVGGSRLTTGGLMHGGYSSSFYRLPIRTWGVEVNLTAPYVSGDPQLHCDPIYGNIPAGSKLTFQVGPAQVTCTVAALSPAAPGATAITITPVGTGIPKGSQAHSRNGAAFGYDALTPMGIVNIGSHINEFNVPILELNGFEEALRFRIAIESAPYLRSADRANTIVTTSGHAYLTTPPPMGSYVVPIEGGEVGKALRLTGNLVGTTIDHHIGPAYDGGTFDEFFMAQAGAGHGVRGTIAVDGVEVGSFDTSGVCLNNNILTLAGVSGLITGGNLLTLATPGASFDSDALDNLLGSLGRAIYATGGAGAFAPGTKIGTITSDTTATLVNDNGAVTPGTNGVVTGISLNGYCPMVRRIPTLGAAGVGHVVTITITGIDTTNENAELIIPFYGIEASNPTAPVIAPLTARTPSTVARWSNIDAGNAVTEAVVAEFGSGVIMPDLDAALAQDPDNFASDGLHLSARGHMKVAMTEYHAGLAAWTLEQISAR